MALLLGAILVRACPPQYDVTQAVEVRVSRRRSLVPDILVTTAAAARSNPSKYAPHEVTLVIEVMSPGSVTMDRVTKPALYAQAGIPFYWRIELDGGVRVFTYRLDPGTEAYSSSGDFTDVIRLDEPWPIDLPIASFAVPGGPLPLRG